MTPFVPRLGQWMPPGSDLTPPDDWAWDRPPPAWAALLTVGRGRPRDRAQILHDLGWAALQAGAWPAASEHFDEGLALCLSQRAARPLRPALLVGLGTTDRVTGAHDRALQRFAAALRGHPGDTVTFAATLGLATTTRVMGQRNLSRRYHFAALHLAGPLGVQADVQALLDLLEPGSGRPDEGLLSPETLARVKLNDAEGLLRAGLPLVWEEDHPPGSAFAQRDELGGLPLLRAALSPGTRDRTTPTVTVVLRGSPGLKIGPRFMPLPGRAVSLALLAYLIEQGSAPWRTVADAVLGTGEAPDDPTTLTVRQREWQQYGQVRYHLARLRLLLGDPQAITLRRGRLALSPSLRWRTDLGRARPPVTCGAPLDWYAPEDASR